MDLPSPPLESSSLLYMASIIALPDSFAVKDRLATAKENFLLLYAPSSEDRRWNNVFSVSTITTDPPPEKSLGNSSSRRTEGLGTWMKTFPLPEAEGGPKRNPALEE